MVIRQLALGILVQTIAETVIIGHSFKKSCFDHSVGCANEQFVAGVFYNEPPVVVADHYVPNEPPANECWQGIPFSRPEWRGNITNLLSQGTNDWGVSLYSPIKKEGS